VILFSRLFLKEQLTLRSGLFIALAFAGMVLLLNPDFRSGTASVPLRAAAIAVMGAAFAGMAYVAVRAAASRIGVNAIVLYFVGVSTLASAPLAIPGFVTPTGAQVLELLCLGIVATVGQLTMTQGYRHAPAGIVSMMSLLNPVFGAAFGLIVFRDHLLLIQWMGMVLVGTALAGLTAQSAKGALSKRSAALREVTGRVASVSE
jgi:drug/metabolite transporter (DMT)-like permease